MKLTYQNYYKNYYQTHKNKYYKSNKKYINQCKKCGLIVRKKRRPKFISKLAHQQKIHKEFYTSKDLVQLIYNVAKPSGNLLIPWSTNQSEFVKQAPLSTTPHYFQDLDDTKLNKTIEYNWLIDNPPFVSERINYVLSNYKIKNIIIIYSAIGWSRLAIKHKLMVLPIPRKLEAYFNPIENKNNNIPTVILTNNQDFFDQWNGISYNK